MAGKIEWLTNMKRKIVINNKMKGAMGRINLNRKGKVVGKKLVIEINKKAHVKNGKLDKAELASSLKHELTHAKYPKMTEKEVYKRTAKTKIDPQEQAKLLAKLRMTKINRKLGAFKRKLKMDRETVEPGSIINKSKSVSNFKQGVYGLI